MRSPIENSPEHIRWLGIIAARWATLDTVLVMLLLKATGNYATAEAIYFSSSSQRLRLDQLRAIIKTCPWPTADKTTAIALIDQLDDLWCKRNDILHNPAIADSAKPDAAYWAQVKRPIRKETERKVPLTLTYLEQHASMLSKIGGDIFTFTWGEEFLKLTDPVQLQPSPETPPQPPPADSSPKTPPENQSSQ